MADTSSIRQRGILAGCPAGRGLVGRGLAVLAALVLAGCQTVVPRGAEPGHYTPPPREKPAQRPAYEPGIPTDTQRQRIALLVPLTGPNAGVGQSLANATQMALLDTRNERIRITTYDTNLGAAAAAQKAIEDGNRLILGPLLAADARAVAPIARHSDVPVISFSNDIGVAGDGTYLMGYLPTQSVERVVDYARSQGVTSFAGLMPNGLYGQRASTSFLRAVEGVGGTVVSLQTYSSANLPGAVTRLSQAGPYQAILLADGGAGANSAMALVRHSGSSARPLGTELWNSDSSIAMRPSLKGAWFASVSDGLYRQYAAKYRARFGAAPYRLSSMGYDAVLLTVRIARDWPMGSPFPESRLHDKGGFAGLDGAFRFGRDDIAERALEVQEIRGGTTIVVSPAPSGF